MSETVRAFATTAGTFMTTHWSLIKESGLQHVAPDRAEAALTRLCRDYWPPLYAFLRRRGYSRADAQDLTQGFFAHLIERQAFTKPRRDYGRFRTFLLVLLKRYVGATWAHQTRQKRGGGTAIFSLDIAQVEALDRVPQGVLTTAAPLDEERLFEWEWAAALVGRAMEALNAEYSSGQKARVFAVLRPFLAGGVGLPTQQEAATRLGISEETFRSHLCRLRARYRALLRAEVLRTVSCEEDIDAELRYLCRVLIAST